MPKLERNTLTIAASIPISQSSVATYGW